MVSASLWLFRRSPKRYSKSRRQAPIYWQLSAGSGSYSTWLYYHRFTQDTIYRVLRDFVEPRIQQAERDQFELESQGALSGDAAAGFTRRRHCFKIYESSRASLISSLLSGIPISMMA